MAEKTETVGLGIGQSFDAGRGGIVTRVEENLYKIEEPGGLDGSESRVTTTITPPVIGIDSWGPNGPKDGASRTTLVITPEPSANWHKKGWPKFIEGLKNSSGAAVDGRRGLPGLASNNQVVFQSKGGE